MPNGHYILDDNNNAILVHDFLEWARWFEGKDRKVARDEIGSVVVSTVFLGLDHSWAPGPPLLFETMIFGGEHDEYQDRCSTWDEAELMHKCATI